MRRGIHWYLQRTDDMNRLLIWFLAFAVFCACSRDLGNYTYTDLDEPDISGIEDCRVMTLSYLRISPSFDDDFDEDFFVDLISKLTDKVKTISSTLSSVNKENDVDSNIIKFK